MNKIKEEQEDIAILGTLISLSHSDTIWTQVTLSVIARIPVERVAKSIVRLRKRQYLVTHVGEYIVTIIGRDYYDEVKHKPEFNL